MFTNFSDRVHDLKEDIAGNLWFTTSDGLFCVQKGTDSIRRIHQEQSRKYNCLTNRFNDFTFDEKDRLWISSPQGLHIYNPANDVFQHRLNNPEKLIALEYPRSATALYYDKKAKQLWFATYDPSLLRYDISANTSTNFYSDKLIRKADQSWLVNEIYPAPSGNLWILTRKGAFLVPNGQRNPVIRYQHNPADPAGIVSNYINGALEDKHGTTWFITDEGISFSPMTKMPFTNYLKNQETAYTFAGKSVTNVMAVDDSLYIVNVYAHDGVYLTDTEFRVKKHFNFKPDVLAWIWTACSDKYTGEIYLAAQNGMLKYIPKDKKVVRLTSTPFDTGQAYSSVLQHDDGTIWFSNYRNYFYRYHPVSGRYKEYDIRNLGIGEQVIRLSKAGNDDIWITASQTGVLRFDSKAEKIVQHLFPRSNPLQGLLQTEPGFVKEFSGNIFIGYDADGFRWYSKYRNSWQHYTRQDGLISNSVRDALLDRYGQLWIATVNGLSRFDTVSNRFINFTNHDGIGNTELVSLSQLPDGRIAAGTRTGLVLFHPGHVEMPTVPDPPLVLEITVQGKQVQPDSLSGKNNPIEISYRANYFSIEYLSLQYQNHHQIEYAYQLKGFDKDWVFAGNRRFISYSNLPGGKYFFKVRCRYPDGKWIENTSPLLFKVHTVFYTRWWFYVFVFALVSYAIYYLYRQKINRLQSELRIRTKIARDLHDNIGSTLSSISVYSQVANIYHKHQQQEALQDTLGKINATSYEMVSEMNDIVWAVNPQNDSMLKIIQRMESFARPLLSTRNILFKMKYDPVVLQANLAMETRKNFYLIFKEAVNNAFKYAGCSEIITEITTNHRRIGMCIKDNGVGFDVQQETEGNKLTLSGNGLRNMRIRAEEIKGQLQIESGALKGTEVKIYLPIP
jgi:ligand-binding sensor domain-containing protein/two-component sensor histidine kinase